MFCENCGAPIPEDAVFCPECGARQDTSASSIQPKSICPFCGEALEPDSVFCSHCGKSLTGQPLSAVDLPHATDVEVPPPIPPVPPGSASKTKQSAVESTVDTGHRKTKPFFLVLGIILGITLLAFVVVRYGDSILPHQEPDQDMSLDSDNDSSTVVTIESTPEITSMQEMTLEQTAEDTLSNEETAKTESESVMETLSEPASVQETIEEANADPGSEPVSSHGRLNYETTEPATLADFKWVTRDIFLGMLPDGSESLTEFEEIEGGWKLYIIDEPDGADGITMERLCRCSFGEDEKGQVICINWDYVHNTATDEGSEENIPDSFYYGSWEHGTFEGLGPGKVTVTNFWIEDGHEYAVGQLFWPDGIHASMFLVRP